LSLTPFNLDTCQGVHVSVHISKLSDTCDKTNINDQIET
jgi:hypothetical protein